MPPYAFACALTVIVALLLERYRRRTLFIIGCSLFSVVGYCLLLSNTAPTTHPGLSYAGVFLAVGGIYPTAALLVSWPAINVSGQTKRAVACGLQFSISNVGAIIGMQLYRAADGPRFIVSHSVAMACLLANVVIVTVLGLRLRAENRRREGLTPEVTDVGAVSDWKGDSDPRWRYQY